MQLYLVQHGQAKSEDVDPDRHLTEKGQNDVKKISFFLKKYGLSVDAIWHSGKTRAAQTADILASGVVVNQAIAQHDGLKPNDAIGPLREELVKADEDLMIVGHLPFLSKLASAIVANSESADVITFQQGGIVCLEQNEELAWSIRWMVIPELLP
ncbi:MAG: phosphohistidine phosphatase SixA [Sedimentisphaerales bacterium]|nr:phosphohistidine phosphatase SixA [Sedimentisphaerales bacterium]